MVIETSSTSQKEASVSGSTTDQIAQLLIDDDEEQFDASEQASAADEGSQEEEPELALEEGEEVEDGDEQEAPEREDGAEDQEGEDVTWASALGVDESKLVLDDDGNFTGVTVKVDGKEDNVDLNTLIAGYQTAKSTTQKSQALAEEKRRIEQQSTEMVGAFQQKLQQAEDFTQLLRSKLQSDYENIDWARLRAEQPAEYAAIQMDKQARERDIEQMVMAIQQNRQAADDAAEQQQKAAKAEFYREQANRTLEMFPEWKDEEKVQADFSAMRSYIEPFGFTAKEFGEIEDPRVFALLKSVITQEEAKKTAAKKVEVATKTPHFRKSTRSRNGRKVTKLDQLVKRAHSAKGSQKRAAQSDAIAELLLTEK